METNMLLKLISSPWFWLDVVLSIVGGILVFWGLKLEKMAESDEYLDAFVDGVKSKKLQAQRGWRILMTGIVVEVVAALGVSIISGLEIAVLNEKSKQLEATNLVLRSNVLVLESQIAETKTSVVKVEPLKQPIGFASATVRIRVHGTNLNPSLTSNAYIKNNPAALLFSASTDSAAHVLLVAESFKSGFNQSKWNEYVLEFHAAPQQAWPRKSVNVEVIDKFDKFQLTTLFLPENASILTGGVWLTLNSTLRTNFLIPAQTNVRYRAVASRENNKWVPLQ
ncbi:MAG: hypothetical protein HZA89_11240 [Verrucomicrobia bacterium]|nr:hypothetical protein [Verrucomicrobiota bacterium]